MKLKLIDIDVTRYETEFGTCELCMYVDEAEESTFVFEKDNGAILRVEGYYWDWGFLTSISVNNIVDLADYVSKQDFPEDTDFDYNWLCNLVDRAERAANER